MANAPELTAPRQAAARGGVTWYAYLLLGYFTYLISIQGNILPFLKAELALSYRAVSLHTSVIAIGLIVVGLFGDRLIRRFGRRRALQIGLIGSVAAVLLLCVSPGAWASIASCALFGLFGGLVPTMVNGILSTVHGSRRDIAFAEANAVAYGFAVMAPILSGACVWLGLNWRAAIVAGAATGIAITAAFFRMALPDVERHRTAGSARLPAAFWLYAIAVGFAVALEFSVLLWAPAYLQQVVGLAPTSAAIGAAAFFLAMLGGRIGGTWLIRVAGARHLVLGAFATTLVGFAAYWTFSLPAVAVTGLFVVGLGISLTFPLLLSFAMGAAREASDRAAPRIMLPPALAILVSPPLLGGIADSLGLGLAQLMTPVAAILMLGAFLVGQAAERR